ncbi:hypothetical protein KKA69_01075 [Patescibacteria group bacterium]|nr:hypothetical protein [Patescibacteria group bacterium]
MENDATPWWLWLIIAAVLIALIFGVLYFFVLGRNRIDLGEVLSRTTPTPAPLAEPTQTPTPIPTLAPILREMPQTGV